MDPTGTFRSSCTVHVDGRLGGCAEYVPVAGTHRCGRCGCVWNKHLPLGKCSECRSCPKYSAMGTVTECVNCACEKSKHRPVLLDPLPADSAAPPQSTTGNPVGQTSSTTRDDLESLRQIIRDERSAQLQDVHQRSPKRFHHSVNTALQQIGGFKRLRHGGYREAAGRPAAGIRKQASTHKACAVTPVHKLSETRYEICALIPAEYVMVENWSTATLTSVLNACSNKFQVQQLPACCLMYKLRGPLITCDQVLQEKPNYYFYSPEFDRNRLIDDFVTPRQLTETNETLSYSESADRDASSPDLEFVGSSSMVPPSRRNIDPDCNDVYKVLVAFERSQRGVRLSLPGNSTTADLFARILEQEPLACEIKLYFDRENVTEIVCSTEALSSVFAAGARNVSVYASEIYSDNSDSLLSEINREMLAFNEGSDCSEAYVRRRSDACPVENREREDDPNVVPENVCDNLEDAVGSLKRHSETLFPPNQVDESQIKLTVLRETLWNDTALMWRIKKRNFGGLRVKITFADCDGNVESGIDLGGLRREYYRLLVQAVCADSGLVIGANGMYTFQANIMKERNLEYRLLGNLTALSALDGGPGLPIFHPSLVQFFLKRTLDVTAPSVDEIPLPEIRHFLTKVFESTTEDELRDVLFNNDYERWGLPIPVADFTMTNRKAMGDHIAIWAMTSRCSLAVEQFLAGLSDYGVDSLLRAHESLRFLLQPEKSQEIDADYVKQNMEAHYESRKNTAKRRAEENLWKNLQIFLDDISEESAAIDDSNLTVGIKEFFVFATGSSQKPAVGLPSKISVRFKYDEDDTIKRFPESHTCALSLDIPVYSEMAGYDYFKEKFVFGIVNSPGFGKL